jgi:hypothetical protein
MFGPAPAVGRIPAVIGLLESLMHWTRVSLFCLSAALLASTPARAQVVDEQTGVVQLDDFSGSMSLSSDGGTWLQVDRMSGDGVGFQNGYTRVGVRAKLLEAGVSHVFTEINGTINDHSRLGTNLGLGWRTLYDGGIFGVHGWYDNYESNYGHNYQQGVIGAEYLHRWLDLRANGYMPFGERENFIGVIDPGTEVICFGHDFGTLGVGQVERSLSGFDAEAGVPLPVAEFLRLYAGPYFLTAKGDDTWGVRSRVEARIGQSATLNFMVTDDERFGTNLNFGATIWYGGGPSSPFKFNRDRSGLARMYDPVRRAQPVQLAQDRVAVNVPLINTDTGVRFNVTWVDNTAAPGGDGTDENPFNTLPSSAPGSDYILVRRGVGNTVGNIVLEDNQKLYGEGRIYTINTDRLGTIEIPDACFDQTGPRPTLLAGNPAQPIVTLADNNEVINFNMIGGGVGIFGNVVTDFRIEHVAINAQNGIFISDANGNGRLNNIDVTANGIGTGVFIRNEGGDVLNANFTDITSTGGAFGLQVLADAATVNALIDGVTTDQTTDTGVVLDNRNAGTLNVDLRNVDIQNTGNITTNGLQISSNGGVANVDLTNVRARGTGDLLTIVGENGATMDVNAIDIDFSNSVAGNGVFIDVDDTIGNFIFTNLTAVNNAVDGFHLDATTGSIINAEIHDSNVSFNGDNNFEVNASGGSVVFFLVDPTLGTDAGSHAFLFTSTDPGTVLDATFEDVDLARAGQSAISGVNSNQGLTRLFLTNVQASDSGLHGLDVTTVDTSDFLTVIRNSTFTRSGIGNNGRGVNLLVQNNSNVLVDMDGTPANNNGAQGLHYEVLTGVDGGSTLLGFVSNGNFSDNPVSNVFGLVSGVGSRANWNFTDVTADLLGNSGSVNLLSIAGGRQDMVWTGATSSISGGNSDGVVLTGIGAGSIINFSFADGRINDNGGRGIDALATAGANVTVNLLDATATGNTQENILAQAFGGGTMTVNATNTNLSNGGLTTNLDNVLLTANGAGSTVGGIFDGAVMDNSGLHGLHAVITGGGSLDLQFLTSDPLNPSSASNNANGSGIRIEAVNADQISVVSSGDSIISNNFADNVDIDVSGANSAAIQIAGFMDGSANGDGINVNYDNVLAGGISIGPGSASNNFDDGVDITVANSTLDQGISVVGMTVTGNGDRPITVQTTNSTITGGTISGNTTDGGDNGITWTSDSGTVDINIVGNTITGATANGILVDLSGTAIGNDVHIDGNTITGDGASPLNGIQLSLRDNAQLLNADPLAPATINGNTVTGAANYGILVSVANNASVDFLEIGGTNGISGSGIDGILYTASGNTTLNDLVIADNISANNVNNGISVLLDSVNGNGNVEFRGNLVSQNGSDGISMTGINTSLTNLDFLGNDSTLNGNNGITIDMSSAGTETLTSVFGQGNNVSDNGNTGLEVNIDGFDPTVDTDVVLLTTTASNNTAGYGIDLNLSNMDFGDVVVQQAVANLNGLDGISVELANANVVNLIVDSSSANTNGGAGLLVESNTASTIGFLGITNNNAGFGTGLSGNTNSGVQLDLDNSTVSGIAIANNDIDANGLHGVELNVTGGTSLPLIADFLVSGNNITNHTAGDGFHLVNPDTGGTDFGINFAGNTITGNTGGSGINLALNSDAGTVTTTFTDNTLSGNGGSGLLMNLTELADLSVTNFQDNNVENNTQMGVRIIAEDFATLFFDGTAGGNVLNENDAAGLGALLTDFSTADIRLSNSTITGTNAGAIADFAGQGIRVFVEDFAILSGNSEFNSNTITGNTTAGVDLLVRDFGTIGGLTINDNTISNNGANAVRIERQESGVVGSGADRLNINGNTISNAQESIFIIAANTDSTDFYEINDNILNNMTISGIHFEVRADADIDVNMDNNQISNAGFDGVLVTDQINAPADSRSVTGVWTNNTITNNGRHGINLAGSTDGLIIGDAGALTFPPPLGNGNLITDNDNDGISITGPGSVTIIGNQISTNGSGGGDDAGIDFSGASFNDISIINNAITSNNGDGIEYEGDGVFGSVANITGNNISFNTGRGLDLLVQPSGNGFSQVDMTFNDNIVSNNQQEGVYIIFTASRTQTQDVASTVALLDNGNVTDTPFLRFNSDGNSITANGINSGFSTTGMVVRVGTTSATTSTTDSGGFASDGVGNFTRSGVIMSVTNTNFGGNFGDDVYFDSFRSVDQANVPTSAGTWGTTDDPTAITTYRADPLARLDLTYFNNGVDSTDTTNVGAFYNNAEGTFKSRANNANAPNQGPFPAASDDRRRNAQRQASRYSTNPPGLAPNTDGIPDTYRYPGMGNSTFRISSTSDAGFFLVDDPTLVGSPTEVDAVFEANGIFYAGFEPGEMPYGWGTF